MIKKVALGAAALAVAGIAATPAQADTIRVGGVISAEVAAGFDENEGPFGLDEGSLDIFLAGGAELDSLLLFNEADAEIVFGLDGAGIGIDFEIEGELSEEYGEGFSAEELDDIFEELTEQGLSNGEAIDVFETIAGTGLLSGFFVD